MSSVKMADPEISQSDEQAKDTLTRLIVVILRRWRLIALTAAVVVVVAVIANALRPKTYTARIVLFQNATESAVTSLVSELPASLVGRAAGRDPSNSRLIGLIARSRSVRDSVAARVGTMPSATVDQNTLDGSITIQVSARDPEVAAELGNTYPDVINLFATRIGLETAQRKQRFLDQQLAMARTRLDAAQDRLVSFQRERGTPQLEGQMEATIAAAMDLEQQIAEEEARVAQLRRELQPDNPELQAAIAQLNLRRQQRQRMQSQAGSASVFTSLQDSPELQATAARLFRDLTEAQQFYTSLAVSLAGSQVGASENLPAVSVLDPALVPDRPSSPGTIVIGLLALVLGLLLGVLAALAAELFGRKDFDSPRVSALRSAWMEAKTDPSGKMRVG